jgi:acyl carrier protein
MTAQQDMQAVFEAIRGVIALVIQVPVEQVTLASPVSALHGVDSIVLLEIIARVENVLDIDIDQDVLFEVRTVSDFVAVCHQQLLAAR